MTDTSGKLLLLLTFTAAAVFGSAAHCLTLEELSGEELAVAMRNAEDPITEVQIKKPSMRLLPQHEELRRYVTETFETLNPNILVETLSLYQKPAVSGEVWSEMQQTNLFNNIAALSTLAGIQYYSESRKVMRIFYETSTIIDNPSDKNLQPDPVFTVLPEALVLYARQKDLTFGDNIYRFDYRTGSDLLFFTQENITAMTAGIIPAIGRNKLRTVVAVIDCGPELLIYSAAMAKTVSLPGMQNRVSASFGNRLSAILKWFSAGADTVFTNEQ